MLAVAELVRSPGREVRSERGAAYPKGDMDVERIRFSEEKRLCEKAAAACDRLNIWTPSPCYASRRRQLRARALHLTDAIAPRAVRALAAAKSRLRITGDIELYHTGDTARDMPRGNALMSFGDPPAIEITGHYLHTLDHAALVALLGHELGHLLAHGPASTFHRT
jgi:Zn-dependent protease with chaperone function